MFANQLLISNKFMKKADYKKYLIGAAAAIFLLTVATGGAIADRLFGIKPLDYLFPRKPSLGTGLEQKVLTEESVVIDVVEKVSPSVVTVSIETPQRRILEFDPFEGFISRFEGGQPQDIGSGFVVSADGLIVTNKHVVSAQEGATYKVITQDGEEYKIEKISRDPSNDVAILKINASNLTPVEFGDATNLKVGQFVIAIGTALGEFRHTVTTGVISGLGRGIIAGSVFEGYVERLDNVIQTDAAINPGNSGGPLLNSAGQVIAVNVAVAQDAENVGFAIPIDMVKQGLEEFNSTGKFIAKPFLGVEYQMIAQRTALLNNVPEGAYIVNVVDNSPAQAAGVQEDDIITRLAGEEIKEDNGGLAKAITDKNPGDRVEIEVWRDGETLKFNVTLSELSE
jgi:serine protease Do